MAEGVGGDVLGDAGIFGATLEDALDAARGEAAKIAGGTDGREVAGVVEEKGGELILPSVEIIRNASGGGFTDEDGAIFLAFATNNEFATLDIDRVAVEAD